MSELFIRMELNRENIKALLMDIVSENIQQPKTGRKLSEAYSEYLRWAEYNLSAKSLSGVNTAFKHLISFRGDIFLHEIDGRFIDQLVIHLMKSAPRGYRVYVRTIRAMFSKFLEWGFISKNLFSSLKLPKQQKNEIKYFSEDEFFRLIEGETNQTLKALYLLSFYTALRLGEIINLDWSNVQLKGKYLLIGDATFTTKARKVRRVPLCSKAAIILENRIPKIYHTSKRNFVFCKRSGFSFSPNYISRRFKKLLRSNGYSEEYHFHSIRHSTASNLARLGVPVPMIQQILGHANIQTTMIYTHIDFTDLINAVAKLDNSSYPQRCEQHS